MTDLVPVRRALISLSDKSGLEGLAGALGRHGVDLVSTGGTAARLREYGLNVRDVSDVRLKSDGFLDVDLRINDQYKVPRTAVAEVIPVGIFGDAAIALKASSPSPT